MQFRNIAPLIRIRSYHARIRLEDFAGEKPRFFNFWLEAGALFAVFGGEFR